MSKFIDDFAIAGESMLRRKIRSFLTILAIVIGIGSVIALIGIGNGLKNTMNDQFEKMGSNKVFITPRGGYYGIGAGVKLKEGDVENIKKVNGVTEVYGWIYKLARVEYNKIMRYDWVMGPNLDGGKYEEAMKSFGVEVIEGKAPKESKKYSAMVGCMLAHDKDNIFGKVMGIEKKFKIEDKEFEVTGSVSCIGNPNDDQQIYINVDTLMEIFDIKEKEYNIIMVTVDAEKNIDTIVENIKENLRKYHNLEKGEEDFEIQTSEEMASTFLRVFNIVVIVVVGIAAISLIVGTVGIANTMFTSILERTREIGAMKAIGATNSDIMSIIIFESGFFGIFGGAVGISVGVGIAKLVSYIVITKFKTLLTIRFSPEVIIGMLLFSFLLGAISGVFPAYRASKMDPVEALRYE